MRTVVTGLSVALPGEDDPRTLLGPAPADPPPVDPTVLIGKKGLRFSDQATRTGLHLAFAALTDAGLLDGKEPVVPGERIGVVVSSNLGNADTVCRAVATIAEETTAGLSPMDIPNASSNIIASETAIRYKLRGPNLTVCNGSTSGLDAVRWADLLLRSRRADHVLVIGTEPDDPATRRLVGGPVVAGGAALVLAREGEGSAAPRALLGRPVRAAGLAAAADRLAEAAPGARLWLTPDPSLVPAGAEHRCLADRGESSGALGVLQCAAAVGWFAEGRPGPVYALAGGGPDGAAALALTAPVRPA
ncbi:beta-ketoacyl synthase N-terminal-like domain-containing protein [Streptomyces cinnamoneus]|uniref:beta-ketoacyl synthase N-terminal-like domain-containing protein n=1 Tax=Streptomyces cinnamoneus TaxID=53446 RepID=UPI0033C5E452